MTSQTYTHFIYVHMRDLVWRRLQTKSLIWAHLKCVYVCEVISTPFNVSNLKDDISVPSTYMQGTIVAMAAKMPEVILTEYGILRTDLAPSWLNDN